MANPNLLHELVQELNRKFTYEEAKAYDPAERYMTLMNNHIRYFKGKVNDWDGHFKDFTAKLRNVIGQNVNKTKQIIEAYESRGTVKAKKPAVKPASPIKKTATAKKPAPVKKSAEPAPVQKKQAPPPQPKKLPAPPAEVWFKYSKEEAKREFNSVEEAEAYDAEAVKAEILAKQNERYNAENCMDWESRYKKFVIKVANIVNTNALKAKKIIKLQSVDSASVAQAEESSMNRHEALEALQKDFPIAFSTAKGWEKRAFKKNIHLDLIPWRKEHKVSKTVMRKLLYHWTQEERYRYGLRKSLISGIRMDLEGNDVRQDLPGSQEKALAMAKQLRMRSTSVEKLAEKYSYVFIYIVLYSIKDEDFKALGKRPLEIATEKLASMTGKEAWHLMDDVVKETGEKLLLCNGNMWIPVKKKNKKAFAKKYNNGTEKSDVVESIDAGTENDTKVTAENVESTETAE